MQLPLIRQFRKLDRIDQLLIGFILGATLFFVLSLLYVSIVYDAKPASVGVSMEGEDDVLALYVQEPREKKRITFAS